MSRGCKSINDSVKQVGDFIEYRHEGLKIKKTITKTSHVGVKRQLYNFI